MDEAFVPHAKRLRIGRRNFCLLSNIKSKESILQLVYDVLHLTPFFKAFLVTVDVPEIYMQEFWATATVHHHSIRFKIDNKKHIINLESFGEMLHICPRLPHQLFVEHKDTKKSNEMYYPRFTKVIIHHFMSKDPSILRRNKVNWHYVRGDHMFTTIKLVSKHQDTQQFSTLLPSELTNEDTRNSNAYKEYYAVATGATPPKPKASIQKTRSSSDITITPPTVAAGPRLTTFEKGKQAAKASKAKSLSALSEVAITEAQQLKLATKRSLQQIHISQASGFGADEGTSSIPGVPDVPTDESEEEISWNSIDEEEEFIHPSLSTHAEEETRDEESFDPILKTPKNTNDEGNGEENLGTNSSSVSSQFVTSMLNPTLDAGMESIFETTSQMDVQTPTSMAPLSMSAPTLTPSTIATTIQQAPNHLTTALSTLLQDLPNFGSLFGLIID
nr:hypothetical protein [Tanacetum cinerariifolium]